MSTSANANPTAMNSLSDIPLAECIGLLGAHQIGRLCVIDDAYPVAFPVNYRIAPNDDGAVVIVVRTRSGNLLDRDQVRAGFEIDGIDGLTQTGWSVVVRGVLHHAGTSPSGTSAASWDPRPWVGPRDSWLVLTPVKITGRRLESSVVEWAFAIEGYL